MTFFLRRLTTARRMRILELFYWGPVGMAVRGLDTQAVGCAGQALAVAARRRRLGQHTVSNSHYRPISHFQPWAGQLLACPAPGFSFVQFSHVAVRHWSRVMMFLSMVCWEFSLGLLDLADGTRLRNDGSLMIFFSRSGLGKISHGVGNPRNLLQARYRE